MNRHLKLSIIILFGLSLLKDFGITAKKILNVNSTVYSKTKDELESSQRKMDNIKSDDNYSADWNEREIDGVKEAADFGLHAMNKLFNIHERKLFDLGLVLESNHPARYVAAFNSQSDEAKNFSKIAYAALKGSNKFIESCGNVSRKMLLNEFKRDSTASWINTRTQFRERCPRSEIPHCPPTSLKYRTPDGSCNNFNHPWWGSAMSTMQRFLNPIYDDGIETIRTSKNGGLLPSARDISMTLHTDKFVPLASLTHMLMQWGQFIDHDMIATAQSRGFNGSFPQCCQMFGTEFQPTELMHPDCLPIAVSPNNKFFGKFGVRCLEFVRSGPAPRKDCGFGPREQLSQVSSFLDASMVYSSNAHHSDSLRLFRNGLLQYGKLASRKPILPRGKPDDLCQRGSLSTNCFRAGDARLSEQPALTTLHVVFLRLHNRIAMELTALNFHWTDEKLYQETRKIIGAIIQHITYNEFLPIILGTEVMKIFKLELKKSGYFDGYDSSINPNIANSFSTAAYRFGHSLVQRGFSRYDSQHKIIFENITIHEEFNNRLDLHSAGSVDRLLMGLINQPSQRRDEFITAELTNHLFQLPNFPFGMDLASINIQRGRDHGLPPYVNWREPCGLSPIRTWQDLEKSIIFSTAQKFQRIYQSVDDIDLFSAGLSEKPVSGGLVGPTFACIIGQQFSNLRRGDRFWYENGNFQNSFTIPQVNQIRRITLAEILCQTMDSIDTIQPFVFLTTDILRNKRISCSDSRLNQLDLQPWVEKQPDQQIPMMIDPSKGRRKNETTNDNPKMFPGLMRRPIKTNVNQKNRVVVKRPFGAAHENLTINVQNHAVNSPIIINDALYGSNLFSSLVPANDNINKYKINHSFGQQNYKISSSTTSTPSYVKVQDSYKSNLGHYSPETIFFYPVSIINYPQAKKYDLPILNKSSSNLQKVQLTSSTKIEGTSTGEYKKNENFILMTNNPAYSKNENNFKSTEFINVTDIDVESNELPRPIKL